MTVVLRESGDRAVPATLPCERNETESWWLRESGRAQPIIYVGLGLDACISAARRSAEGPAPCRAEVVLVHKSAGRLKGDR